MKPYYEENGITIYHGDCREILPHLEPVDLVLTDPPYGIGLAANPFRQKFERLAWDDKPVDATLLAGIIAKGKDAIVWGGNYFGATSSSAVPSVGQGAARRFLFGYVRAGMDHAQGTSQDICPPCGELPQGPPYTEAA